TYGTKAQGKGGTRKPAGTVKDAGSGDGAADYLITFGPITTGVINKRAITVTALTNTKDYDGTTSAAAVPTITAGTLATGDVGTFTETYDTKTQGTGKTLTPAGTVKDAGSVDVTADYLITFG